MKSPDRFQTVFDPAVDYQLFHHPIFVVSFIDTANSYKFLLSFVNSCQFKIHNKNTNFSLFGTARAPLCYSPSKMSFLTVLTQSKELDPS